ncbi:unnamed protein product [Bemisia tabaci]|uniref:Sarcospan n=1 Tax=Bemisia tabaci TaxID=7038 RepID=A0A9P0AEH1_BEMTA|nr:PREDICTED: uncharacterized protein LOC109042185 [Bemisia tabaci]CAH0390050.1 unnamed protein product [Bemisia tabaci]
MSYPSYCGFARGGLEPELLPPPQTHATMPPSPLTPRANGTGQNQRPLSLYDNLQSSRTNSLMGSGSLCGGMSGGGGCRGGSGSMSVGNLTAIGTKINQSIDNSNSGERLPSQLHNMSTTVPQNISNNTIGGRHAPTRSSLRHSRMIVLNKHGKVPRKYQVPIIYDYKMATSLVILQIILGFVVCSLATWLILWAPRLSVPLIPYWSGIPLALSGVFGVMLMCCFRKDHPGLPLSSCALVFKVLSLLITGVACVACLTAGISAVLHLVFLYDATCQPINTVNTTCVCDGVINPTFEYFDVVTYVFGSSYHYFDLNCLQVRHILTVLLIGSSIANFLASLMLILYIYLHCSCRSGYKYSKISTRSKSQSYLYR